MAKKVDLVNKFFDINKFPAEKGLFVFPISLSKITTSQTAAKYHDHLEFLGTKIVKKAVGVTFLYTEGLYLKGSIKDTDDFIKKLITERDHRQSFINLVKKHPWFIEDAFSFFSWVQMFIESDKTIFPNMFLELKKLYKSDDTFQKYLAQDAQELKLTLTENQIDFFLEEFLVSYLILKGIIKLNNNYTQGNEKRILIAYDGTPPKGLAYLHQKNFFKLGNSQNKYENCFYDLKKRVLYDFTKMDLDSWNYE